jgi:hypothetical protein
VVGRERGRDVGLSAGPVTVRLPKVVAQREQRNSYNSPAGSTSKSRSRTGCELPHLGQYNSLAVKVPNCSCELLLHRLNFHSVLENINQHLGWRLVGIDAVQPFLAIEIQDRLALPLVGFESSADDVNIGVIEPVFL